MYTVVDVAAYILDNYGPMTTMKLEKLTFYSQAYSLVVTGAPMFEEDFEAWVNGPVAPALYRKHKGKFLIHPGELAFAVADHEPLADDIKDLVDTVCARLAALSGNKLSALTHSEDPWVNARRGYAPSQHCEQIIPKAAMKSYYAHHQTWLLA